MTSHTSNQKLWDMARGGISTANQHDVDSDRTEEDIARERARILAKVNRAGIGDRARYDSSDDGDSADG